MYDSLFTPKSIGGLELKNRLIVSAAVTRLCNEDNTISEAFIRYQEDKAKGGWGLIITEDQPVTPDALTYPNLPGIYDDRFAEGQKALTSRIHAAGGRLCAQLYHPGAASRRSVTGVQPKAPSAVIFPGFSEEPMELTIAEIRAIVKAFGQAARRAKEWGYDMVEIHAAHGYLIHQFLSGNSNKRTDGYGGSLVNRNRFLLEVIAEVREKVGRDFPLQLRISATDYTLGGITLEESMVSCHLAEDAGIDSIHVSQGTAGIGCAIIPPAATDRSLYVNNAAAIKQAVSVPVITVGRINEPVLAENIIRSGRADFVTMFRASVADPEVPLKLQEGRFEEINYCIGCMQGCSGSNRRLDRFSCLVRPLTGRAHEYPIIPVEERLKIAVIGGGISGCEAAIFAAMRGHKVTVFERTDRLGGRWIAASTPPGKSGYTAFVNWQKAMLKKYGVELKLNTEVTLEAMRNFAPDKIVLATGARDFIPPIPGVKGDNVVLAQDVLRSRSHTGKNIVVIGGGLVGAETADYLAVCGGKKVSVIEMQGAICVDGEPAPTKIILDSFKAHGVDVFTNAAVKEISADAVSFMYEGVLHRIPCDTVVMATGIRPENSFYEELCTLGIPVIKSGDAMSGKDGINNIREGFQVGLSL